MTTTVSPSTATRGGMTLLTTPAPWPRAALLLWAVYLLVLLPWRDLTPIDETRYVAVAWEMWLRGDFVVPWLNGEPYAHKPPLLFWLIQAGWAVFGVNKWWPLAVPAIASGVSLLLLHRIATRLWPERGAVAQVAPLMLFACGMWTMLSAAVYFDVLLVAFVLLGIDALLDIAHDRPWRGGVLFAVSIGAGLLAKGPLVGINLLPVALALPWWRRGMGRARWWHGWVVIAVAGALGMAVAGAWLAAAVARTDMNFLREVAFAQGFGRVVNSFDHRLPFWWYLPMLALVAFPWFWWLDGWRALAVLRRHLDEPGVRLALVWSVAVFLMLSVISGKRAQYLLGMLPALSLLWARGLEPRLGERAGRFGAWPATALMVVAGGVVMMLTRVVPADKAPPWLSAIPPWLGMVPVAIGLLWLLAPRVLGTRLLALAAGSAAAIAFGLSVTAHLIDPAYELEPQSRRVAELARQGVPLAVVDEYHGQFHFAGRLREPLPWLHPRDVPGWLAKHPDGRVIVSVRRLPSPAPADAWWYRSGWVVVVDAQQWLQLDLR